MAAAFVLANSQDVTSFATPITNATSRVTSIDVTSSRSGAMRNVSLQSTDVDPTTKIDDTVSIFQHTSPSGPSTISHQTRSVNVTNETISARQRFGSTSSINNHEGGQPSETVLIRQTVPSTMIGASLPSEIQPSNYFENVSEPYSTRTQKVLEATAQLTPSVDIGDNLANTKTPLLTPSATISQSPFPIDSRHTIATNNARTMPRSVINTHSEPSSGVTDHLATESNIAVSKTTQSPSIREEASPTQDVVLFAFTLAVNGRQPSSASSVETEIPNITSSKIVENTASRTADSAAVSQRARKNETARVLQPTTSAHDVTSTTSSRTMATPPLTSQTLRTTDAHASIRHAETVQLNNSNSGDLSSTGEYNSLTPSQGVPSTYPGQDRNQSSASIDSVDGQFVADRTAPLNDGSSTAQRRLATNDRTTMAESPRVLESAVDTAAVQSSLDDTIFSRISKALLYDDDDDTSWLPTSVSPVNPSLTAPHTTPLATPCANCPSVSFSKTTEREFTRQSINPSSSVSSVYTGSASAINVTPSSPSTVMQDVTSHANDSVPDGTPPSSVATSDEANTRSVIGTETSLVGGGDNTSTERTARALNGSTIPIIGSVESSTSLTATDATAADKTGTYDAVTRRQRSSGFSTDRSPSLPLTHRATTIPSGEVTTQTDSVMSHSSVVRTVSLVIEPTPTFTERATVISTASAVAGASYLQATTVGISNETLSFPTSNISVDATPTAGVTSLESSGTGTVIMTSTLGATISPTPSSASLYDTASASVTVVDASVVAKATLLPSEAFVSTVDVAARNTSRHGAGVTSLYGSDVTTRYDEIASTPATLTENGDVIASTSSVLIETSDRNHKTDILRSTIYPDSNNVNGTVSRTYNDVSTTDYKPEVTIDPTGNGTDTDVTKLPDTGDGITNSQTTTETSTFTEDEITHSQATSSTTVPITGRTNTTTSNTTVNGTTTSYVTPITSVSENGSLGSTSNSPTTTAPRYDTNGSAPTSENNSSSDAERNSSLTSPTTNSRETVNATGSIPPELVTTAGTSNDTTAGITESGITTLTTKDLIETTNATDSTSLQNNTDTTDITNYLTATPPVNSITDMKNDNESSITGPPVDNITVTANVTEYFTTSQPGSNVTETMNNESNITASPVYNVTATTNASDYVTTTLPIHNVTATPGEIDPIVTSIPDNNVTDARNVTDYFTTVLPISNVTETGNVTGPIVTSFPANNVTELINVTEPSLTSPPVNDVNETVDVTESIVTSPVNNVTANVAESTLTSLPVNDVSEISNVTHPTPTSPSVGDINGSADVTLPSATSPPAYTLTELPTTTTTTATTVTSVVAPDTLLTIQIKPLYGHQIKDINYIKQLEQGKWYLCRAHPVFINKDRHSGRLRSHTKCRTPIDEANVKVFFYGPFPSRVVCYGPPHSCARMCCSASLRLNAQTDNLSF